MLNWIPVARWFYGLVAAFIGGGASAVTTSFTASMIAPDKFNLAGQWKALMTLVAVTFTINGAISAFFYLSKAPVPDWDATQPDRRSQP